MARADGREVPEKPEVHARRPHPGVALDVLEALIEATYTRDARRAAPRQPGDREAAVFVPTRRRPRCSIDGATSSGALARETGRLIGGWMKTCGATEGGTRCRHGMTNLFARNRQFSRSTRRRPPRDPRQTQEAGRRGVLRQSGARDARLERELHGGEYRPGRYVAFEVHDPKKRIGFGRTVPRSRRASCAVRQSSSRFSKRGFIDNSFANRMGKGTHRAIAAYERYRDRHTHVLALRHLPLLSRPSTMRS